MLHLQICIILLLVTFYHIYLIDSANEPVLCMIMSNKIEMENFLIGMNRIIFYDMKS